MAEENRASEQQIYLENFITVHLSNDDVGEGLKLCDGRIFSRKPVNKNAVEVTFKSIWENQKGFRVEELKLKFFQLLFE